MSFKHLLKKRLGLYPKVSITKKIEKIRFGNSYGGFEVNEGGLNKGSIVYSFGIGKDISFDKDIIDRFNCLLFAYDPTPEVADWICSQEISDKFLFHPIGLSDMDGNLTFYTPINSEHISHTSVRMSPFQNEVIVPCKRLKTIMQENGHYSIDLLKIDIEGFEYTVLEDLMREKLDIKQIVVEFHHNFKGIGNEKTENAISKLIAIGYDLFSISENYQEFSFFRCNVKS